jgi:DNA-binding CsgD family transcriptional regulator
LTTSIFFFKPSILWGAFLVVSSFLSGICIGAWGFYFKKFTPTNERIKTAADVLIYSNILMIAINVISINLSAYAGLFFSICLLLVTLYFVEKLPKNVEMDVASNNELNGQKSMSIIKPLAFLCFFIIIITINSGLMYQVINPEFFHHKFLVSWYWALPYVVALYIMRNLPNDSNRTYVLYVSIAMIGFSFIAFMILDRSAISYIIVDTLMLGACGVYDLFWWSILGEMLEFHKNPAKILGIGLSANVMGVLIGGLIGNVISKTDIKSINSSVIALVVVFITLIILPVLHKHLLTLLKKHAYLTVLSEIPNEEKKHESGEFVILNQLTERESEIASLLLKGRTYKMIANELYLSENTVKTHIKNIYSKFNIKSKAELIKLLVEKYPATFN